MSGEPAELGVYERLAHERLAHERHLFATAPEPITRARLHAAHPHTVLSHTTVATDGPASDLEGTDAP